MSDPSLSRRRLADAAALLLGLLFIALAMPFVPGAGIQQDEALFAGGIYPPITIEYASARLGGAPVMLMNYIGALKIWVYRPLLAVFGPSVYTLRVPVVLAGAISILLFYYLLRTWAGVGAALAGALLLVADSTYLLTTTFDWGPVAFQHLLTLTGFLCVVFYQRSGRRLWVALAGFSFGVVLWDKAISIWALAALAAAVSVTYARGVIRFLKKPTTWGAGLLGFLAGSLPLLVYNLKTGWKTFAGHAEISLANLGFRGLVFWRSLDSSALFDYLLRDEVYTPRQVQPGSLLWLSDALSRFFGQTQSNLLPFAVLASLLLLPFCARAGRRRLALLLVLTFVFGVGLILATSGAGGGVHHYVLLWPLPQAIVALAATEAIARWPKTARAAGLAILLTAVSGLAVTNQYFVQLSYDGPASRWTDAIFPMHRWAVENRPRQIFVMDWGIYDPLRFLSAGKLPLAGGTETILFHLDEPDKLATVVRSIKDPRMVFFGHTDENEVFTGLNAILRDVARQNDYEEVTLQTFRDRRGRPVLRAFRFQPRGGLHIAVEGAEPH